MCTSRPPVEPDLYARSVQKGVDPTAPQATSPLRARHKAKARVHAHRARTRETTDISQSALRTGPQACGVISFPHRWRTSVANRSLEETDADRQEETKDGASTAHFRLQNSRPNSAISGFRAGRCKIEYKRRRLNDEDTNDKKRERHLCSLYARVHSDFFGFL